MNNFRPILMAVIFTFSSMTLWDRWQQHQGKPPLFFSQPTTDNSTSATPKSQEDTPSIPGVATNENISGQEAANGVAPVSKPVTIETPIYRATIDTVGGKIVQLALMKYPQNEVEAKGTFADNFRHFFNTPDPKDAKPVVLLDQKAHHYYIARSGYVDAAGSQPLPNHNTEFVFKTQTTSDQGTTIHLEGRTASAVIDRQIILRNDYQIAFKDRITNLSPTTIKPMFYGEIVHNGVTKAGSMFYSTFSGFARYDTENKYHKIDFKDIADRSAENIDAAKDGWMAYVEHYFVSSWILPKGLVRSFYTEHLSNGLYRGGVRSVLTNIPPGGTYEHTATLYSGPQIESLLHKAADQLDVVKDYGWLSFVAKPLFWLLNFLHGLLGNWGWAIVLMTLIIKLLFYKLSAASFISMAKMKDVGPKMQELKERYGNDPQRLNGAMMELYRKEKINPAAGCLPILIQIPVFIAFYWVLLATVEMRGAPWILWIKDLSLPDPYLILPLIMAGTMILQTALNPVPPDPLQAKIMKIMPLVFSVMFFFFPAGLVLYWVVNNILSIAQQKFIQSRHGDAGSKKA